MYRAVDTGLRTIDVRSLTEAGQSLGSGTLRILWSVIFPNLRVAILSGAFLTLAIVIGEFTLANYLARPAFGPYLSRLGQNRSYEPAAVSLISFGLTWLAMGVIAFLGRSGGGRSGRSKSAGATDDHRPPPPRASPRPDPSRRSRPTDELSRPPGHPEAVRRLGRRRELQPRGREGRVRVVPRPVRLRQDDDPPDDRRLRAADGRHDHGRRDGHHLPPAEPAQRRDGVPVVRPVPEHDRRRQHRVRAEDPQEDRRTRSASASASCSR